MLRFGEFSLEPAQRRLSDGQGSAVDLPARCFDALVLLVREAGGLVTKDRFLDEVWSGVPVTDEALTQAIRTLRKSLGDDASAPRFIETVPKHGYRFIAPVGQGGAVATPARIEPEPEPVSVPARPSPVTLAAAGVAGGAAAGAVIGLLYGLFADAGEAGALSMVLVLACLSFLAALVSAFGILLGVILLGGFGPASGAVRMIMGGLSGGLLTGVFARLIGLDAFRMLLGRGPETIAGAGEGALLGAAMGLGAWLVLRSARAATVLLAALAGGCAALAAFAAGGTLMGGSLVALAEAFPGSRLALDFAVTGMVGWVAAFLEGALFVGGASWAIRATVRR